MSSRERWRAALELLGRATALVGSLFGLVAMILAQVQLVRIAFALIESGNVNSSALVTVIVAIAFIALSSRFGKAWFSAAQGLAGHAARGVTGWRGQAPLPPMDPRHHPPDARPVEPEIPIDSPVACTCPPDNSPFGWEGHLPGCPLAPEKRYRPDQWGGPR